MTRTIRSNSLPHEDAALPRLFGKSTPGYSSPYKTKKNGAGKGNWGREGDELADVEDEYNFQPSIQRRRSNSNGGNGSFKKPSFERDPIFDEAVDEIED
ncbi:hypothetical protein BZA70DRAFT_272273 [Myxozyma melibiosi]|uniref:Hyaluronan/mRNA-binding protein domain-containing protein n=1 Tax=Myxozyma melibiosi TaxID=54550 RepID=A0ABR1FD84_9ASCO